MCENQCERKCHSCITSVMLKPEYEKEVDEKSVGVYDKFIVHRSDGSSEPGGKHEHCKFFVLDLNHDPHALVALSAYADSCELDYPQLAADLRQIVSSFCQ